MSASPPPAPGDRTLNLDPNLAAALSYVGGMISGIVFLVLEKQNRYVRFHAMQSTITFLLVLVADLMLVGLGVVGMVLAVPFVIAVVVLWIFLMFKAMNGVRYKLPYIGDWAEQQVR
ncbi:MAG TPA: DUF4870 domain-containing protein [Vicinamibacterales bacterium]|nr:DUF4870 domain-containing protein [Vicinamibacterales bacterium]